MIRVMFNEDQCKGCGLCVVYCPQGIIQLTNKLNKKGYRSAQVVEQHKCTSCMACARMCPDAVITVFRPNRKKSEAS